MNIRGLLMKTFGKFAITWEGDKYRIVFPGYMQVEEVQQRAVIPLFYESLANSLGYVQSCRCWRNAMPIPNDDPELHESRYWERARAMEHARHLREIYAKEQIVLNAEDLKPGPPCTCDSPHSSVIFHSLGQTHTWCPRSFWATRAMARCRHMTQEERAKWLQTYPLTQFLERFALPASDACTSLPTAMPVGVAVFHEDAYG